MGQQCPALLLFSGGCDNFVCGKIDQCIVYPKEQDFKWNGKRMACRFFYKNQEKGQMTIMDLYKEVSNGD